MDNLKKVVRFILFPPMAVALIFSLLSFTYLIIVLYNGFEGTPAYVSYAFSAFGLYYFISAFFVPVIGKIVGYIFNDEFVASYLKDSEFKARFGLYTGAALNIIYALFKMISGIALESIWFIAIAFYYIFLSFIRIALVKTDISVYKRPAYDKYERQWKGYLVSGCLMLLFNVALTGIIVLVIKHDNSFYYPDFMIYACAAYAFCRMYLAVRGLITDMRDRSPLVSAVRAINFSAAVVAMFTLQTAMLARFSDNPESARSINVVTGTAVAVIAGFISLYMISRGIYMLTHKKETG